jgi:DNA polymerase III epsilon subunit-like protein
MGIACPPHYVSDTFDMACQLYHAWSSHSLEKIAIRPNVANGAEHRARSDARLDKDIFLAMLQRTPTVNKFSDLKCLSPPLTFANAPGCNIEAPPGFEVLTTAIAV